jgi:hypothetical protein
MGPVMDDDRRIARLVLQTGLFQQEARCLYYTLLCRHAHYPVLTDKIFIQALEKRVKDILSQTFFIIVISIKGLF